MLKAGQKFPDFHLKNQDGKYVAATAIRATTQAGAALTARPLAWIDKGGATPSAPTLKC